MKRMLLPSNWPERSGRRYPSNDIDAKACANQSNRHVPSSGRTTVDAALSGARRMMARRHLAVSVIALVAALSACDGSDSPSAGQPQHETTQSAPSDTAGAETSAAAIRYLALGDSLTQGVGAPDGQTGAFPALLTERWRADGCDVELRNVGVS